MRVTGVDACRGGWVAVSLDGPAGAEEIEEVEGVEGASLLRVEMVRVHETLEGVLDGHRSRVVGIAMPLGPLAHSKHTAAGRERRRELLSRAGITLPRIPRAPVTDTLDATAVACSAWRIATGRAVVIPARPQRDDRGLKIAIRY